jgi:hypothetical protein
VSDKEAPRDGLDEFQNAADLVGDLLSSKTTLGDLGRELMDKVFGKKAEEPAQPTKLTSIDGGKKCNS